MSAFAILVDFHLKPGAQGAFRRLVDANALQSLRDEDGCRRFDVLEPAGSDDRVLLYEIYDDRAAFVAHLESEHFVRFDAESGPLVAKKSVVECNLVLEATA
jgi:quinol monooxygenase YgiN